MNELNDENVELQGRYDAQKELYCQLNSDKNNIWQDYQDLKKENEQLKQAQASTLREFEKGVKKVQKLAKENKQLKQALKNSYISEICENCKYGNYFQTYSSEFLEYDFECTKKHFDDAWERGLEDCDEFELDLEGLLNEK